jgi:uncharacterized protein (TIGR00255 family)
MTTSFSSTPLKSMTGFGTAEAPFGQGRVRAEVRTVNHRFLNLQLRLPTGLDALVAGVERVLRAQFARGHVSLSVSLEFDAGGVEESFPAVQPDLARARGIVAALQEVQDSLGLPGEVTIREIARFREILKVPEDPSLRPPPIEASLLEAVVQAAALAASAMRVEEGVRLAEDLSTRLDRMLEAVEAVDARVPERLVRERDRIQEQIQRLLPDGVAPDPDRLAREVAHLAERWDIHEEIVRFRSHVEMFRSTLEGGSTEGVGKRFGFIAQEMLREVNTMGSKANDAEITRHVLALKEELERLREQLENVE